MKQKKSEPIVAPWIIEKIKLEVIPVPNSFTESYVRGLAKLKGEKRKGSCYFGMVVPTWKLEEQPGKLFSECVDAVNRFARRKKNEHKTKGK